VQETLNQKHRENQCHIHQLAKMIMPCIYTVPIVMLLQIIAQNELELSIIIRMTDVLRTMKRWK